MSTDIRLVHAGPLTQDEYQYLRARLRASFDDAEAAWNTYRQHLIDIRPPRTELLESWEGLARN